MGLREELSTLLSCLEDSEQETAALQEQLGCLVGAGDARACAQGLQGLLPSTVPIPAGEGERGAAHQPAGAHHRGTESPMPTPPWTHLWLPHDHLTAGTHPRFISTAPRLGSAACPELPAAGEDQRSPHAAPGELDAPLSSRLPQACPSCASDRPRDRGGRDGHVAVPTGWLGWRGDPDGGLQAPQKSCGGTRWFG